MQDVPLKHRNDPQSFSKLHFVFKKPERVDIVGSYPIKTVTKPMLNIDLAVQIPQVCSLPSIRNKLGSI